MSGDRHARYVADLFDAEEGVPVRPVDDAIIMLASIMLISIMPK